MTRLAITMAALGLFSATGAQAVNLYGPALYSSTGTVASNNGAASCAQVGLTVNAPSSSVLFYPGAGKTGLTVYVPLSGVLQLCNGFPAVPAGGLNGFNANSNCTVYTAGGNIPTSGVNYVFASTTEDANSTIGSTTVTIPADAPIGAGCSAVIDTTIVRSGK